MFTTVSWGSYWGFVASLLVVYYAGLLLFYYKKRLMGRLQHATMGIRHQDATNEEGLFKPVTGGTCGPEIGVPQHGPFFLPSLEDEIQSFFESIDVDTSTKETLLASVKKIIDQYPGVKGTAKQFSISSRIVFLAEHHGSVHLSTEEAGSVWM